MHQLIRLWAALLLGGCAAEPVATPVSFRAANAPIWSNAQFDISRLTGRWQQVAGFSTDGKDCAPGGIEVSGKLPSQTIAGRLCLNGQSLSFSGPLSATGPGRLTVADQEWWVIWVDTDYRTMAIGTPSGAFGFILNRGGARPADRLRAAREIFDFNGYDTKGLKIF